MPRLDFSLTGNNDGEQSPSPRLELDFDSSCGVTGSGSGGVVSTLGLTMPADVFTVAPSPITGSGTFGVTFKVQSLHTVLIGPLTGADAVPTFRTLDPTDIPNLSATYATEGNNG